MTFALKIGVIVSPRGPSSEQDLRLTSNRGLFQIRILPDMEEIEETDLLPWYPNFFANIFKAYAVGDVVWVLSSEDYQVGYILGWAEPPAGESIVDMLSIINTIEEEAKLEKSTQTSLSIEEVSGEMIRFRNIHTGLVGIIYNSYTYYLISPRGDIYVKNPFFKGIINNQGEISLQGTSKKETYTSSEITTVDSIENTTSKVLNISNTSKESVGGSKQITIGSNYTEYIAGESSLLTAKTKKETIGLGEETKIIAGGQTTQILSGNFTLTAALGNISLTTAVGTITITSTGEVSFNSTSKISLRAPLIELLSPLIKFPAGASVVNPSTSGPFCALPNCLFTGAPHTGNIHTGT